MIFRDYTEKIC